MEKRVFRSKIVYWISIIYFLFISLFTLITIFNFFVESKVTFLFFLIITFFSNLIFVLLIKNNSKVVLIINLYLCLIIIIFLISNYSLYSENKLKFLNVFILIFHLIYLFLVNYFKAKPNDIKGIEEIDEIGKQ